MCSYVSRPHSLSYPTPAFVYELRPQSELELGKYCSNAAPGKLASVPQKTKPTRGPSSAEMPRRSCASSRVYLSLANAGNDRPLPCRIVSFPGAALFVRLIKQGAAPAAREAITAPKNIEPRRNSPARARVVHVIDASGHNDAAGRKRRTTAKVRGGGSRPPGRIRHNAACFRSRHKGKPAG